jgi:hypothetical protein
MTSFPCSDEGIRDGEHSSQSPPEDENLQAIVLVDVYVQRRHDELMIGMLNIRQSHLQVPRAVVIYERDSCDYIDVG